MRFFFVNAFFSFGFLLLLGNSLLPGADEATGRSLSHAFCPALMRCSSPGRAQRLSPSLPLKSHLSLGKWGWQMEVGRVTIAVDSAFLLPPHVFIWNAQSATKLPFSYHSTSETCSFYISCSEQQRCSPLVMCECHLSGLPLPMSPVSDVFSLLVCLQHLCILQSSAGIRAMCLHKLVSLSFQYGD